MAEFLSACLSSRLSGWELRKGDEQCLSFLQSYQGQRDRWHHLKNSHRSMQEHKDTAFAKPATSSTQGNHCFLTSQEDGFLATLHSCLCYPGKPRCCSVWDERTDLPCEWNLQQCWGYGGAGDGLWRSFASCVKCGRGGLLFVNFPAQILQAQCSPTVTPLQSPFRFGRPAGRAQVLTFCLEQFPWLWLGHGGQWRPQKQVSAPHCLLRAQV